MALTVGARDRHVACPPVAGGHLEPAQSVPLRWRPILVLTVLYAMANPWTLARSIARFPWGTRTGVRRPGGDPGKAIRTNDWACLP